MIKFPIDLSINEDQIFNWTYVEHISEVQYSSACLYHWCIHRTSSLCWKFHPSEEYVRGFDIQCRTLSSILNKYSANDVQLLMDIYTNLIQWLVLALRNADSENYDFVFDYIRSKKNLLNQYYVPPTLFKRIFKYGFVYLNIPNKLLFRLVENVRKFIWFDEEWYYSQKEMVCELDKRNLRVRSDSNSSL